MSNGEPCRRDPALLTQVTPKVVVTPIMGRIKPVVLYVEDEETDRFLIQRAFVKEGLAAALRMVNDGQAAIDYLSGAGVYADPEEFPRPGVVLLDLNLPEVHGFEVLRWIRERSPQPELPVVIFTSSARTEDREQARLLGANDFIEKPGLPSLFQEIARKLCQGLAGADRCQK